MHESRRHGTAGPSHNSNIADDDWIRGGQTGIGTAGWGG